VGFCDGISDGILDAISNVETTESISSLLNIPDAIKASARAAVSDASTCIVFPSATSSASTSAAVALVPVVLISFAMMS